MYCEGNSCKHANERAQAQTYPPHIHSHTHPDKLRERVAGWEETYTNLGEVMNVVEEDCHMKGKRITRQECVLRTSVT